MIQEFLDIDSNLPTMSDQNITDIPIHQLTSMVQLKLKNDNFITWKALLQPIIRKLKLLGFLDGTNRCPAQFTVRNNRNNQKTDVENPAYTKWIDEDQTIIMWLQSTLSESVVAYFVGAPTSHILWTNLEEKFSRVSATHTIQLRTKIQSTKQVNLSMTNYLNSLDKISD